MNSLSKVESHISKLITSFENLNLFPLNILIDNNTTLMVIISYRYYNNVNHITYVSFLMNLFRLNITLY